MSSTEVARPDWRQIVERLKARSTQLDRPKVEAALRLHFERLGIPCPPIHWAADAPAAYEAAESAAWSAAESAARPAAESAAWRAARSAAWSAVRSAAESAARPAAESAAWSAAESAAWRAARLAVRSAAEFAARWAAWSAAWSAAESAVRSAAWSAAESAARPAAESAVWWAAESAAWSAVRSAAESAARPAAESAAWPAARSAAWSAAWSAAIDRWIAIWLPFVEAHEAGLWLFWVMPAEVIACPRPQIQVESESDRLHSIDGPAVAWAGGARFYFWRGVRIPEKYYERSISAAGIFCEPNVAVRRALIERYDATKGKGSWIVDVGAQVIDTGVQKMLGGRPDTINELLEIALPEGPEGRMVALRVIDPSTGRSYVLRVPPDQTTVASALAWTFGLSEREYVLEAES